MSLLTSHADQHLREVIDLQFDPKWGSPYWLDRVGEIGFDPRREIFGLEDLPRLGAFPEDDLATGSSLRFIPQAFHKEHAHLIPAETGGTTGRPKRVWFLESEFRAGFIDPFLSLCRRVGWPQGARWLFLGPSGPHIIGRVVDPICRELDSPPAHRIDFDPRWSLRLSPGSFARDRYLDHLVEQAVDIVKREPIEVLFATPPLLVRLAEQMSESERKRIRGVHYAGLALTHDDYRQFKEDLFPCALHLSGYGNSWVGVAFETGPTQAEELRYYPTSHRHQIRVDQTDESRICGEPGQIVVSRIDRSFFIPNLVERDVGVSIEPNEASLQLEWSGPGVWNPHPNPKRALVGKGLY